MTGLPSGEVARIPGVAVVPGGFRTTWDVAPSVAELLGVACPSHPLSDTEAMQAAVATLPGLPRFKELNLHTRLRPYQVQDAATLALWSWGFLANPMRSGKTPTAIASTVLSGSPKTLCVVPAIALYGWAEDIAKFANRSAVILEGRAADRLRVFCVTCMGSGRINGQHCSDCKMKNGQSRGSRLILKEREGVLFYKILQLASYIVVNYEIIGQQINRGGNGRLYLVPHLPGWEATLRHLNCDTVLLDESHMLRGWPRRQAGSIREGTSTAERIFNLCESVPRVICISGTPQFGRVEHWWQQLRITSKNAAACVGGESTPFAFHVRYCNGHKGPYGWDSTGTSDLAPTELAGRVRNFSIMRSLDSIYADLPKKQRRTIRLDKEVLYSDKDVQALKRLAMEKNVNRVKSKVKALCTQTAKLKLPTILEAVKADITPDTKTMVVCYYPATADSYHKEFQKKLAKFTSVSGKPVKLFIAHGDGISITERRARAKEFREYQGPAVFIMTIDAFQVGVSLRGALTEHWVEIHHDPAACLQAEARPYEPDPETGKLDERGLLINYYVVQSSIDEHRLDLLLPKVESLDAVMGDADAGAMMTAFEAEPFEQFATNLLSRLTAHLSSVAEFEEETDSEPDVDMDTLESFM